MVIFAWGFLNVCFEEPKNTHGSKYKRIYYLIPQWPRSLPQSWVMFCFLCMVSSWILFIDKQIDILLHVFAQIIAHNSHCSSLFRYQYDLQIISYLNVRRLLIHSYAFTIFHYMQAIHVFTKSPIHGYRGNLQFFAL